MSLTEEFGQGFSETQVRNFRKFYLTFTDLQIQQALPAEFRSRLAAIRQTPSAESAGKLRIAQVPSGLTSPFKTSPPLPTLTGANPSRR